MEGCADLAVALAEALAESEALTGQQPHSRPPASKHAVRALTREKLSEQRLKELGGPDAQCSVCRRGPPSLHRPLPNLSCRAITGLPKYTVGCCPGLLLFLDAAPDGMKNDDYPGRKMQQQ